MGPTHFWQHDVLAGVSLGASPHLALWQAMEVCGGLSPAPLQTLRWRRKAQRSHIGTPTSWPPLWHACRAACSSSGQAAATALRLGMGRLPCRQLTIKGSSGSWFKRSAFPLCARPAGLQG